MDWSDIKDLVGKAAPVIGTALGGRGGAVAGSLIANFLGVEENPEAVAAAVKNDPQAYLKLRELESNEKVEFQRIAMETLAIELKDMQDARNSHKHSLMPTIICCSLTALVGVGGYLLFNTPIPDENKATMFTFFGVLLGKWGDSIAYWVGTTRSSAQKTSIISEKR